MKLGWFGLCLCLGITIVSVSARSELVLDAQQITLSTQRNQAVSKSLRLTSTEDLTAPLQVTVSDLELADGRDRILAQAITLTPQSAPLSANQTEVLEIQLPGTALNTSGKFTGSLLLQYGESSRTLPVTVNVKAPALLPLITLLAGAGLGTMLSLYRKAGLPKDELLVRVGKLRTQMRADRDVAAERFKAMAKGELIAVETALSNRDWKTAETRLQNAQSVWTQWLSAKPDWVVQITYLQELLSEIKGTSDYQQALKAELEAIERQIAQQPTPQALAALIEPVREQLARYQRGDRLLQRLSDLSGELKDTKQVDQWNEIRTRLEHELNDLNPKQVDEFKDWLKRVQDTEKELVKAVQQQPTGTTETTRGLTAAPTGSGPRPVPAVGARGRQLPEESAQKNLAVFRWVSQAAAIVLIAWLGMAELYEKEATFGRYPIGDYFGLFAWGFGAEVSRDAIVKALGDLKAPLSIKKQENS